MTAPTQRPLYPWLIGLALVIGVLYLLVGRNLTLEDIKRIAAEATALARTQPALVGLALVVAQAAGMAFSLPTKALLTLLAGSLFGPLWGTLITFGGVLAGTSALFFAVRRGLRQRFEARLGARARKLERRFARHPILTLAGLRLVITLPYGPITIASALTTIGYRQFLAGSLLGDVPVVLLYCFAGERLATLATTSEAISPLTVVLLIAAGLAFLVTAFVGLRRDADG